MNNNLIRRYFQLAAEYNRCHVGSGYTCLPIIDDIYKSKREEDIFILSCGHASLAWYVVLEDHYNISAHNYLKKSPIHPDTDQENHIFCSSGSLGHGLGIAIGAALANKEITVHCLISDGECSEGSIFEALRVIYEQHIKNIIVHVNINGYNGYDVLDRAYYIDLLSAALPFAQLKIYQTDYKDIPFLNGVDAHYYRVTNDDLRYINENFV